MAEGPRCADWAREVGVDPIGSAPTPPAWLLVDWPLPWPRDVGEVEALAPLREVGARVQLVLPRADDAGSSVVLHRPARDDGWFAGYERSSRCVAPSEVVDAAVDLVSGSAVDREQVADVLLCTHGARDRCCGSLGTALAVHALAAGIALRRTSHTGGHRFAPTAVLLPEGTAWAFLDDDALARIVARDGPLDDLLPRYRGCTGIGSPAVQAVERMAFAEVGWSWLDHRRRGVELGDGRVRVEAVAPDGTELSWEAQTEPGRTLPVPDCGQPLAAARKTETEVVVRPASRSF
jgi:hypothetical protein